MPGSLALDALRRLRRGMTWWALGLVALNYLGFGVRGFQMSARGRMAWASRVLLAPYRIGAATNAALPDEDPPAE